MRGYAFPEAGAVAVKHIFHWPAEKVGKGLQVFFRNMGHVGFAATAGFQANERDENIIVGKLDLGEKKLLCVYDSGDFHESPVFLTILRPLVRNRTSCASIFLPHDSEN